MIVATTQKNSVSGSLVATQQFGSKKRWGEELPSKFIIAIVRGSKEEEGKEEKKEEEGEGEKKEEKKRKRLGVAMVVGMWSSVAPSS
jgi:hypothetical protein